MKTSEETEANLRRGFGARDLWIAAPGSNLSQSISSKGPGARNLLPDYLDQHALFPPAVEFAVEDLLPGSEVELAAGYRDDRPRVPSPVA